MKSVLNIARAELRYMATSPIAWGVSFVLVLLFAQNYIGVLSAYVSQAERGILRDALTYILTVFCPAAAWMKQPFLMMAKFVFPFLFMNVISREFSSGTIRLIQSSPVSVSAFVWGKFLGLMAYVAVLVSIYGILVIVCCFSIVAPEIPLLLWQLIALLLYFFFIAAICLFASSLSPYALVGGVVSILLIVGTNLLNNVGQATALGDFFYPLSHQAIGERLITGGIDWNDVIVLLVFAAFFVMLTIVHLQNKAGNFSQSKRAIRFGVILLSTFLLIALLPYTPIDFTDIRRENAASVHPNMQRILNELNEGPLEVTHYFNVISAPDLSSNAVPEAQPATKYNTWRPYMRHKKDIHVHVKYYYALDTADHYTQMLVKAYQGKSDMEIARIMADTYGYDLDEVMTLEEAQKEVDIKGNEYIPHIIKLAYQGRETQVLGPFGAMPEDKHFYPAFERLITGRGQEVFFVRDGRPREVYYRTAESQYFTNKQILIQSPSWVLMGPLQDSIRLDQEDLPMDAKALILLGPREPISDTALQKIKRFIDEGGNLMFAGEPAFREYAKPVLDYLGLKMMSGVVIQPTPGLGSARILGALTPESTRFFGTELSSLRADFFGLSHDTLHMIFDGASALHITDVSDFEVTPLVYSRKGDSWNRPIVHNYDSLQLLIEKQPTDEDGSFPLMVMLHREVNGRQQRILVSGDVDFIKWHNAFKGDGWKDGVGASFSMNMLTAMTNSMFPVNLERPFLPDKGFRVSMGGVHTQKAFLVYALPALIVIGGAYTIIKRRRK